MTIGERIKQRRKELGMTVDELAVKLNKNRATIYRYESNQIESLPAHILKPLSTALNVSAEYLMGWSEEEESEGLEKLISDINNENNINLENILNTEKLSLPIINEPDSEINLFDFECDFCYRATDNSMDKSGIYKDSIVFVKSCKLKSGNIGLFEIDNIPILKRVYFYEDKNQIILSSDSAEFPPLFLTYEEFNKLKLCGKAIGIYNKI